MLTALKRTYSPERFASVVDNLSVSTTKRIRKMLVTTAFTEYVSYLIKSCSDASLDKQKAKFQTEFSYFISQNPEYLDNATYMTILNKLCESFTVNGRPDYTIKNKLCKTLGKIQGMEAFKSSLESDEGESGPVDFGDYDSENPETPAAPEGVSDDTANMKSQLGYDIVTGYYKELKTRLSNQHDMWFLRV